VLGIMFRPAGFRPLLGRALSTIRDTTLPWAAVVGPEAADAALAGAVAAAPDGEAMAAAADAALAGAVPARDLTASFGMPPGRYLVANAADDRRPS
jgi:hypothetical protein